MQLRAPEGCGVALVENVAAAGHGELGAAPQTEHEFFAGMRGRLRRSAQIQKPAIQLAARQAARIGGYAGDEYLDPTDRPLIEAGEGVAEGFELAEDDLIEAAETADGWADPGRNPFTSEIEARDTTPDYSEADHESSSARLDDDR